MSTLTPTHFTRGGVSQVLQTVGKPSADADPEKARFQHNIRVCRTLSSTLLCFQNKNSSDPSIISKLSAPIPNKEGAILANYNPSLNASQTSTGNMLIGNVLPAGAIIKCSSQTSPYAPNLNAINTLIQRHLLADLTSLVLDYLPEKSFYRPSCIVSVIALCPKSPTASPPFGVTFQRTKEGTSFDFTHESYLASSKELLAPVTAPSDTASIGVKQSSLVLMDALGPPADSYFVSLPMVPHSFDLNAAPTDVPPQLFTRRVAKNTTTGESEDLLIQWHFIAVDALELNSAEKITRFAERLKFVHDNKL